MTVVLGSDCKRGFHQQGGPTELLEGSIAGLDGDGGGDLRLGIPKEMEHR